MLVENYEAACKKRGCEVRAVVADQLRSVDERQPFAIALPGNSNALFSNRLRDEDVAAVCDAVLDTAGVAVTELDLSYNCMTCDGAAAVAEVVEKMKSLRSLSVASNEVAGKGCTALVTAAEQSSLERLDLSQNPLGTPAATHVASLLSRLATLRELRLSDTDMGMDAVVAVANGIMHSPAIQSLELDNPRLSGTAQDTTLLLSKAVRANSTLRRLSLRKHRIRDNGALLLAQALQRNEALEAIDLSCNEIGAVGAEALAALVIRGSALRHISLAHNRVCDEGARSMAAALRADPELETLDLRSNSIADDGLCAVAQGLESNSALRRLELWGNEFGEEACEHLATLYERRLQYQAVALDFAPYRVDGRAMVCHVDAE